MRRRSFAATSRCCRAHSASVGERCSSAHDSRCRSIGTCASQQSTEQNTSAVRERLHRPDYSQDKSRLRIELNANETLAEIMSALLRLAQETDTHVEGINSTGRQLEDAYLKLITEDEFSGFLRATK